MYATEQDIVDRYSQDELLLAFDRDGDGAVDLDAQGKSVALKALQDASDEIDGYLAGRYPLPLTAAQGKVLTGYCVDIALYKGSVGTVQTDQKRRRYEDAVKFLRLVGEGRLKLGIPAAEEPAAQETTHVDAPPRLFGRDTLERY